MVETAGLLVATTLVIGLVIKFILLIYDLSGALHNKKCNFNNEKLKLQGFKIDKLSNDPYIVVIRNFLTPEMIDHVVNLAENRFDRSRIIGLEEDQLSEVRTSSSCVLLKSETRMIKSIEDRVCEITGYSPSHLEELQVVRYLQGQKYDPHFDYFPKSDPASKRYVADRGQRAITMFIYLKTPEKGGETYFPKLDLKVKPDPGDAIFWFDLHRDGREHPLTLHGGLPVEEGNKMAINVWLRDPCTLHDL
jgi:prolyl 4-hydroxylase